MCDRKALKHILATRPSPPLKDRLKTINEAKDAFAGIGTKLNSIMRNKERSGEAAGLDREAVKKLNHEALEKARIYERIKEEVEAGTQGILGEENVFCYWLGDKHPHVEDLHSGWSVLWNHCQYHENGAFDVILDDESCEGLFECTKRMVDELTNIEMRLRHSVLASRALGMEIPAAVMEALESDPKMFGELKAKLFSDLYADAITALSKREQEEVISELLKILYPDDWKELAIQTDPAALEKNMERAEARKWKDELKRKHPAAYFTMRDITALREFAYDKMENAERFVELVEKGILPSDALFLLFGKASDRQLEFHLSVDLCLCVEGLRHADIFHATKRLSEVDCGRLATNLNAYARWMQAMPVEIPDAERQLISAVLSINLGAPEKRSDVFGLLLNNAVGAIREIQRSCPECMGNFFAYFIASWHEAKNGGEFPLRPAAPHESLGFSREMNYYIGQDEVSAEDVRLALAYAMKGTEGNSSRGGRYISTTAFRGMMKKVLPRNDVKDVLPWQKRDPVIRASEVELHLANHGAFIYKRNDQLIGLNMDESGKTRSDKEPTERGREILRVTREWMLERDRIAKEHALAQATENGLPAADATEGAEAAGNRQGFFERARAAVDEYSKGLAERFLKEGDVNEIVRVLRERFAGEGPGQAEQMAAELVKRGETP